jgi:acetate kinase
MRKEGIHVDEVMTLLNKQSGLLGVSGESLDTRVLMEHYDSNSREVGDGYVLISRSQGR